MSKYSAEKGNGGIRLIKRAAVVVLALAVGLSVATKIVFLCVFQESRAPSKTVYALPENKFEPFIFAGVEVSLPWSRITNVYVHDHTVVFGAEDNKQFSIFRLWNISEESRTFDNVRKVRRQTMAGRMKDTIQECLIGDIAPLLVHPEMVGRFYVPRSANVTWRSSPLTDFRTAAGLLYIRYITGEFEDRRETETPFMRGYQMRMKSFTGPVNTYDLGMKDGSYGLTVGMPEGTEEFAAPLLSSIRVVVLPANYSRMAFEKSTSFAQASAGDPSRDKLALLTAIEAASNTTPNLEYYTHVLDLCRRFRIARLVPPWLGEALIAFPSSRDKLIARYPEFYPNRRR